MDLFDLSAKISLDSSEYDRSLQNASSAAEKWATKFVMAAKTAASGLSVVVNGITSITKQAVSNYSSYQQLVGGIETLFGTQGKSFEDWSKTFSESSDSMEDYIAVARKVMNGDFGTGSERKDLLAQAGYDPDTVQQMVNNLINGVDVASGVSADTISANMQTAEEKYASLERAQSKAMENARNAYQTVGVSANEYMETITTFAASLNQSLGGDTEKSVEKADMALQDMADNANKMGTPLQSLQMAYQGFAKGQYQLLDNLKLGYGGTKTEMQRLLSDAQKLTGVKYDINNLADVYDAIHVIQQETGITGTTAEEAATTIEGSTKMMKASWQNVLTSLVTGGDFFEESLDGLISSVKIFADNIIPAIRGALEGVGALISGVAPVLLAMLPGMVEELLPGLVDAVISVIDGILDAMPDLLKTLETVTPMVLSALADFVPSVIAFLVDGIPQFVSTGITMLTYLVTGLTENIPAIVPQLTQGMIDIVDQLINIIETGGADLAGAGLAMLSALADALVTAVPNVLTQLTQLIQDLTASMTTAAEGDSESLLTTATTILSNLVDGLMTSLPTVIPALTTAAAEFITQFANLIGSDTTSLVNGAIGMLKALVDGLATSIPQVIGNITDAALALVDALIDALVNIDVVTFADACASLVGSIAEGLVGAVGKITERLPELITTIVAWLTNPENFMGILNAAVTIGGELISQVPAILESLASALLGIVTGIATYFTDHGDEILQGLKDGFANVTQTISELWQDKIKPAFDDLGEKIKNFFLQFEWGQALLDFVGAIGRAISGAWDTLKDVFTGAAGFAGKVGEWLGSLDLLDAGKKLVDSLKKGLEGAWEGIKTWFTDKFTHLFDDIDLSKLKFWEKWGKGKGNGEQIEGDELSSESEGSIDMPSGMMTLDYSNLQPISSDTIASYEQLAAAINLINAAISGGDGEEAAGEAAGAAEGGAESAGTGLNAAFSSIKTLIEGITSALQVLAAYMVGDFLTAVMTLTEALCVISEDEEGNTDAGGGNTLYNALGAIQGVLGDILAQSMNIEENWRGEFVSAVETMKRYAGKAEGALESMAGKANAAADAFNEAAEAVWAYIAALQALADFRNGGGGKGTGSSTTGGNQPKAAASGGRLNPNETWLVGEKGPELFTPKQSGWIIPNDRLTSKNSERPINVTIEGSIYGEKYLQDYVVDTLTGTIRKELQLAS